MIHPYAIERPDEVYVPWGRPADGGEPPGIYADAMTTALAGLDRMMERVTFDTDMRLGGILWEATARLRRLDEKIRNAVRAREVAILNPALRWPMQPCLPGRLHPVEVFGVSQTR